MVVSTGGFGVGVVGCVGGGCRSSSSSSIRQIAGLRQLTEEGGRGMEKGHGWVGLVVRGGLSTLMHVGGGGASGRRAPVLCCACSLVLVQLWLWSCYWSCWYPAGPAGPAPAPTRHLGSLASLRICSLAVLSLGTSWHAPPVLRYSHIQYSTYIPRPPQPPCRRHWTGAPRPPLHTGFISPAVVDQLICSPSSLRVLGPTRPSGRRVNPRCPGGGRRTAADKRAS